MCHIKGNALERRKCIFPYERLEILDKPNETQLPPLKLFYSKIKQNDITDEDYEQAKR